MQIITLPPLDQEQRYWAAKVLVEIAGMEWAAASAVVARTPGPVYWSEDTGKAYEVRRALEEAGLRPESNTGSPASAEADRYRVYTEEMTRLEARERFEQGKRAHSTAEQTAVINSGSWGAATFSSIYLLAMKAYGQAVLLFALSFIPFVNIVAWIYYIVKGKRIAWESRKWRDFEDFLACQRVWDTWAKWVFFILLGLLVLAALAGEKPGQFGI